MEKFLLAKLKVVGIEWRAIPYQDNYYYYGTHIRLREAIIKSL